MLAGGGKEMIAYRPRPRRPSSATGTTSKLRDNIGHSFNSTWYVIYVRGSWEGTLKS
jgi:hypothetical protein